MTHVMIIGSGPSGVAAALQLARRGLKPLILDVGYEPGEAIPRIEGGLYENRQRRDVFDFHIGSDFRGLSNLLGRGYVPVKLLAPNMSFVTQDAEQLSPIDAEGYSAVQSFSRGGLGNLWGAGLYRFTSRDLEGFPIKAADLEPYLDELTCEIGISGADDDLTPFFGSPARLQKALALSHNVQTLYKNYQRLKPAFRKKGMYLGAPRLGVLSEPYRGRPAYGYTNLEFWQESPSIYSPRLTLDRLIEQGQAEYEKGILAESFSEESGGVCIRVLRLRDRQPFEFHARKLILAAGAINTSRIVLKSFQDHNTKLRLLENPAFQIPFLLPRSIGRALETRSFGLTQLNLVWEHRGLNQLLQGSIIEPTSPLRAEFFAHFPFSAAANLTMVKYLLPALIVLQLFFPSSPEQGMAELSLQENGRLKIVGVPNTIPRETMKDLFRLFARLGAWSHPKLLVCPPSGHSIHYAGTLPMTEKPGPYTCDVRGKLFSTRNVFVADAANFPSLPAKNMSLSMMANAMRIADCVADELVSLL